MTTNISKTHDALTLSEIRSHIGLFLMDSNKDLITCMLVCKSWRSDFRRLLYYHLELTKRTLGPIILPLQWRSYSPYTHSLIIAEPTAISRGKQPTFGGSKSRGNNPSSKDGATLRSPDYNLDPAIHCPNLLHLTVKVNPRLLPLSCWTKQDAWLEVGENAVESEDSQQELLFKTSAVVRYDMQQEAFLVKTSNRILALLHHRPRLQTFRWIGASATHMDQLGRYLVTREHQLVELQLQLLKTSVPELNRIISNCPWLRRLYLGTLLLESELSWPELASTNKGSLAPTISAVTQPSQEVQSTVLDLGPIQILTLAAPRFPLLQVHVHGLSLERLHLSDCCFPAGFTPNNQQTDPLDSEPAPSTPGPGVYWNCPQLKTYKHEGSSTPFMFVHGLLDSCRHSLTSFTALNYIFDLDFVPSLVARNHGQVITHLDLRDSTRIKSTEIQSLLCHCTELIEFYGPQGVLWGEDLMQSGLSWSCLKLRKLQQLICLARPDSDMWEQSMRQGQMEGPLSFPLQRILGPEYSVSQLWARSRPPDNAGADIEHQTSRPSMQLKDVQDAIYQQLSRLTQLEVLDLTGGGSGSHHFLVEYPLGIPWTLEAGLNKLSGLTKMRELVVTGWEHKMSMKEVVWFKQHWPELRSIKSTSEDSVPIVDDEEMKQDEDQIVLWLAFKICLAKEWPERFSDNTTK